MKAIYKSTLILVSILLVITLAACGGSSAEDFSEDSADSGAAPDVVAEAAFDMGEPAAEPLDVLGSEAEDAGAPPADVPSVPLGTQAVFNLGGDTLIGASNASDRLIIKNAEMTLLVADTAVAIDRLTQIVGDFGGYIISSREWFVDWYGDNYKNATYTFAVPVDQFERALGRLRGISVRVLDERATGEDVTQEFVDLESRLRNLEATRDRIRTFLDRATTVEEALEVNQELSNIDAQIEETKGRMNFLVGRAAFSTITVTLEPELPDFVPTATPTSTPTATPTATPTSTATFTPTPWSPGDTFSNASQTLGSAYRNMAELTIWLLVVVIPIFAPFVLIVWYFIWRANMRSRATAKEAKEKK